MPRICYVEKRFSRSSRDLISKANQVIYAFEEKGFSLNLRQLYYQFVSRNYIPNTVREYKKLGSVINDARLAGLIDWNAIEDRTRYLRTLAHWENISEIIKDCSEQFRINQWDNQSYRPEVWIEKDALVGVIEEVCERYDVPYFSCRGYPSQSEAWRASRRFMEYVKKKQLPIILHLGDHDPSGIDMTRDIKNRMEIFRTHIQVKRIALTMDQIDEHDPPPNPAKITDSRYKSYNELYGEDSWELDALDPIVLTGLVEDEIKELIDKKEWKKTERRIKKGRRELVKISEEREIE